MTLPSAPACSQESTTTPFNLDRSAGDSPTPNRPRGSSRVTQRRNSLFTHAGPWALYASWATAPASCGRAQARCTAVSQLRLRVARSTAKAAGCAPDRARATHASSLATVCLSTGVETAGRLSEKKEAVSRKTRSAYLHQEHADKGPWRRLRLGAESGSASQWRFAPHKRSEGGRRRAALASDEAAQRERRPQQIPTDELQTTTVSSRRHPPPCLPPGPLNRHRCAPSSPGTLPREGGA